MFSYLRVSLVSGGVGWGESAAKFRGYPESVPRVCPVYFLEILVLELTGVYGDSATGVGSALRLVGVPPLKVVVSTRLIPWEAGADLVVVRSTES